MNLLLFLIFIGLIALFIYLMNYGVCNRCLRTMKKEELCLDESLVEKLEDSNQNLKIALLKCKNDIECKKNQVN